MSSLQLFVMAGALFALTVCAGALALISDPNTAHMEFNSLWWVVALMFAIATVGCLLAGLTQGDEE